MNVAEECAGAEVFEQEESRAISGQRSGFPANLAISIFESTSVERSINTCSLTCHDSMLILRRRDADNYFYK
jgi:hypothetical protein